MSVAELVERERRVHRHFHTLAGVSLAVGATCFIVIIAGVVLGDSRWLALPRFVPITVWAIVIAVNVAAILLTRSVLGARTSVATIAGGLEREHALRVGSVRGVMEVADSGDLGRHASAALVARLARVSGHLIPEERRRARRRMMWMGGMQLAGVALLVMIVPLYGDGLNAVIRPIAAWDGTLLAPIHFEDLPSAVVRGEQLSVRIAAPGRRTLTLERRDVGEAWHGEPVSVDSGTATFHLGPMTGDVYLVATDGRASTDTALIRVTDRPFLGGIAMRATYPAYLERPPENLPVGEAVSVPAGTRLDVSGRASTALNFVVLMSERDTAIVNASGRAFRGAFVPRVSGAWAWRAVGVSGPVTDVPSPMDIQVIPDSAPRAEIVVPSHDTLVGVADQLTMRLAAADDHGIRSIDIVSWTTNSAGAGVPSTDHLASAAGPVWGTVVLLDVQQRGLHPGDALHIKLTATDNSPSAQRGESRELLVKVATPEEQRAMARASGDSAVAAAQAAVAAQKALERRTADAAQERGKRSNPDASDANSMNFDAAQKTKALADDQKALADQVKKLGQSAKSLEDQLRQAGALDSGLSKQLQEAQAMLRDALTPEMLAQMQKLEQAAQGLSKDDAQQSMRDLQAQQQRLREQLEKSGEMLRRAAMEGAMQTLTDEARDLAKEQRTLADSTPPSPQPAQPAQPKSGANGAPSQSQQAKDLADRSGRLADDMQKLEQRLDQQKASTGAAKADEAKQHAQASEEKLRAAGAEPPKGASSGAGAQKTASQGGAPQQGGSQQQSGSQQNESQQLQQQAARDAAAQMDQAATSMKAARDGQVQEWKQELTSALDQSIQEMLQMSRQENALQQQVKSGEAKGDDARGQQSAIKQGLDAAAQRLQKEAQKSSLLSGRSQRAVSDAQQKVDQATQNTADAKTSPTSGNSMNDAADALNKAAASLARDRERANTVSSATGFAEMLQEMQQMAGKQGSINSQAQSIMPMPGSSMSGAAQAQARSLARQQRQVADQLDELGDGAGGDKAAKMAQEARQLADALDGSRIDAATRARQEQLFKKLLDAGRSLEKEDREESDKREAKSATDAKQFAPANTNATGKNATRFREPTWDELRGLTADERRVILEYFKALNGHGG